MSKDKLQLLSPLFLKYQSDFEKNPRGRVFAPLAEAYRKLGMTDKAMEILSQGIRYNPTYTMGYLGLAFCYFDLKQFNLTYTTLRPLIDSNRDNLRLQKLFADTCLELGKQEEALETLKYLLFINPRDKEVASHVLSLEKEIDDRYKPNHKPIIIPEKDLTSDGNAHDNSLFDLKKLTPAPGTDINNFDDWMTIDLSHDSASQAKTNSSDVKLVQVNYDNWNVRKSDQVHEEAPLKKEIPKDVTRTFAVHLDLDNDSEIDEEPTEHVLKNNDNNTPLVTHTLVDLYCGQGHIEKALEVLEKILLLNPNDQKTIEKIKEIQALIQPLEKYDVVEHQSKKVPLIAPYIEDELFAEPVQPNNHPTELNDLLDTTEEDGRRHLMSLIDEKLGPIEIEGPSKAEIVRAVEEKLGQFLKKIQKRALDYQGRV